MPFSQLVSSTGRVEQENKPTIAFQKSIGLLISAINSGKIIAPPYANTIFIIPFTFENSGRCVNAVLLMGPGEMPKAAVAPTKLGEECATTPMVMKIVRRFSQTALLYVR